MALAREDDAVLFVHVPNDIRDRTRTLAKRMRTSMAQIVREALAERVEYLEARFRTAAERATKEKEEERKRRAEAKQRRSLARLLPLGARSLSTLDGDLTPERLHASATPDLPAPDEDRLGDLYREQARQLLEVVSTPPLARRLRVAEAVAAIKREAPLTHPPEGEIVARLEQEVKRLEASTAEHAPPTEEKEKEEEEEKEERRIDPHHVRSFGSVEP